MSRISENQLILPSLFLMSVSPNESITTSELIKKLIDLMKPDEEDLERIPNRSDSRFSQTVRNLKSHNTFERYGFAKYGNGIYRISEQGRQYIESNYELLNILFKNSLTFDSLKDGLDDLHKGIFEEEKRIEIFDEDFEIREGTKRIKETNIYRRSKDLRNFAIDYYKYNGKINCKVCEFNFEDFYGPEIGEGYIEIHHKKPIYKYTKDELSQFISNAVQNVLPVCSNCHRMIHKDWRKPLEIEYLKEQISNYGR